MGRGSALCGSGLDPYLGKAAAIAERKEQARTVIVTARITPRLAEYLDRIVRREFVSRSQLLAEMIETYIERDEVGDEYAMR